MDISAVIGELQRSNAALSAEAARLKAELREVVDEYNHLESVSAQRETATHTLTHVYTTTSRTYFAAIRALWAAATRAPGGAEAAALDEAAQRALLAALNQTDAAKRELTHAHMHTVAAAAVPADIDTDDLARSAVGFTADSVRRQERELFTTALRELREAADSSAALCARTQEELERVRAHADSQSRLAATAAAELTNARARIAALESSLAATQAQLQESILSRAHESAMAQTVTDRSASSPQKPIAALEVRGRLFTPGDVADLLDRCEALSAASARAPSVPSPEARAQSRALTQTHAAPTATAILDNTAALSPGVVGQLAAFSSSTGAADSSTLMAAIARESAMYLSRATNAEARAADLQAQMNDISLSHQAEVTALRAQAAGADAANAQLTRTVNALRHELQLAQDRYAAQAGVLDMLRLELADAQARLTKLQTHKMEMARRAASALHEVEGQVAALTATVASIKTTGKTAAGLGVH